MLSAQISVLSFNKCLGLSLRQFGILRFMAVKVILQPPEPILATVCNAVVDFSAISELIEDLTDTLHNQVNPLGVGLSAPQIGVNARVFVMQIPEGELRVVVNPQILERSQAMTTPVANRKFLEGCLSLPDLYGEVSRAQWVKVEYMAKQSGKFVKRSLKLEGFESRVFQHEMDHLNGILFTQRIKEQGGRLYRLEIKDGEEVLVEVNSL